MTALLKHISDSDGVKSFSILPFIKGAQLIVNKMILEGLERVACTFNLVCH